MVNYHHKFHSHVFCCRDYILSMRFDIMRRPAWVSSYHIQDWVTLDRRCKLAVLLTRCQAIRTSCVQRPIRVRVVYTCAILQYLCLTNEPTTLRPNRMIITPKDVVSISLNEEDGDFGLFPRPVVNTDHSLEMLLRSLRRKAWGCIRQIKRRLSHMNGKSATHRAPA